MKSSGIESKGIKSKSPGECDRKTMMKGEGFVWMDVKLFVRGREIVGKC